MRNLVKYVGIGLLVMGLAACDDKDTNATAQGSVAESNATGNPYHRFRETSLCWEEFIAGFFFKHIIRFTLISSLMRRLLYWCRHLLFQRKAHK